jgi:hypothetical protein
MNFGNFQSLSNFFRKYLNYLVGDLEKAKKSMIRVIWDLRTETGFFAGIGDEPQGYFQKPGFSPTLRKFYYCVACFPHNVAGSAV